MEPRFRDASRSLPFEAAARSHEALPDRDIGRDRHGSGRGSPDPGRAIEAPIVAPDGTALAPLDSAFARLIIHLATDENAGRGRFGQPTKFVMNIPGMTLEEREAVRLLGSEDTGRMIAIADKYAKSAIGAKARLGLPSGGIDYMGDVGAARGPGQYGGMPGGLGRYLGAGSGHGGIGLPGGHSYGGGPDAGGFGGSGGLSLSPYLLGGSHHGGVNVPGGHTVGGGPDAGGLGGSDVGLGQLPSTPGGPSRGSRDDGTYGYGTGRFGSGAQLPTGAWRALHPGGYVTDDPSRDDRKKKPPEGAPVDPAKNKKPRADRTAEDDKKDLEEAEAKDAKREAELKKKMDAADHEQGGEINGAIIGGVGGGVVAIILAYSEAPVPLKIIFGVAWVAGGAYGGSRLLSNPKKDRPSDEGTGPAGPRAMAYRDLNDAFPADDGSSPVGPRARTRGRQFVGDDVRPADDGSSPGGPRSTIGSGWDFLPDPDAGGPVTPRS